MKKGQTNKSSLDSLNNDEIIMSIKAGFFSLDRKIRDLDVYKNDEDRSGTTVCAALVTQSHIYLINCGDSRAILIRDDYIEMCTYDHKPTQLKERQRIQNAGGIVALSRVNGGLATSRGLGDFEYKSVPNFKQNEQFVSCEPDVYVAKRDPTRDKFLVLACDGIWDVMKNEEVLDYIKTYHARNPPALQKSNQATFLTQMNNSMLDLCFEKGSKDNMTIVTVQFNDSLVDNRERRSSSAMNRPSSRIGSARK